MREIKFRAWDKTNRKLLLVCDVNFTAMGHLDFITVWDTELECGYTLDAHDKSFDLLQYTGLKDKNGKEIYEGDWVETPGGIGDVFWDKCYYMRWNPNDMTTLHDCQQNHLEVIGNIWENKELLEASNAK